MSVGVMIVHAQRYDFIHSFKNSLGFACETLPTFTYPLVIRILLFVHIPTYIYLFIQKNSFYVLRIVIFK